MMMLPRRVPYPKTPEQVEACLDLAEAGEIVVDRGDAPAVVIMPAEEYARLVALDTDAPTSLRVRLRMSQALSPRL